jgi:hypothetical protein
MLWDAACSAIVHRDLADLHHDLAELFCASS